MAGYRAVWSSGYTVQWRDLTWGEYRQISSRRQYTYPDALDFEVAYEVYKTARISGPDPKVVGFGIVQYIARQQILDSPFNGSQVTVEKALLEARTAVADDVLLQAQARIAAAFRYTLEEIDTWTATQVFLRLAQTEVLLGPAFGAAATPQPQPAPRAGNRHAMAQSRAQERDAGLEVQHFQVTSNKHR